jgi:hypothetical protein
MQKRTSPQKFLRALSSFTLRLDKRCAAAKPAALIRANRNSLRAWTGNTGGPVEPHQHPDNSGLDNATSRRSPAAVRDCGRGVIIPESTA